MGRYSAFGVGGALSSPGRTILEVTGASGVRPLIYDIVLSSSDTPADNAFIWKVMRGTTAGTATSFTPTLLDPSDPKAATGGANANASAEPTITANSELLDLALNMRATFRWVAAPGGELVVALGTPGTNRVAMRCQHASATSNMRATAHWSE